jgi:hypothetical protein
MSKIIFISQSNYIPWKGYFDAIAKADVFVIYDDVQFTRQDWRNRNIIKTPNGLKWLSISVEMKGRLNRRINEIKVVDRNWNKSHLETLKQFYKKAPCYNEMIEWIEPLYRNCDSEFLTDINRYFIEAINDFLGIKTILKNSSEFNLVDDRNERLIQICQELGGSIYLSGPSAKNYLDVDLFNRNKIDVEFINNSNYLEYQQLFGLFEHGVSIMDLIFNEGHNSINFLNNNK